MSLVIPSQKPLGQHTPQASLSSVPISIQHQNCRVVHMVPPTNYPVSFPGSHHSEELKAVRAELEVTRRQLSQSLTICEVSNKTLLQHIETTKNCLKQLEDVRLSDQLKDDHIIALQNKINMMTLRLQTQNEFVKTLLLIHSKMFSASSSPSR